MFKRAERRKAKLRLALSGTSGSGKTTGALLIAKGLGGRIAVLDTERGSASLYANLVDFDVVELGPPYTPERFTEVVNAAEKSGYDTLILDSITHEWKGAGGVLQIVEDLARSKFRGNSYAAWNEGTPRHQKFIDSMLHSNMHIICTMRSKAVYVESERNGKKALTKEAAAPEQRDGLEYEFTAVLDIHREGNLALASKDRTNLFKDPLVITEQVGVDLLEWLEQGADAPPPKDNEATHEETSPTLPYELFDLDKLDEEYSKFHRTEHLVSAWKKLWKEFGPAEGHPQLAEATAIKDRHKSRLAFVGDSQAPAEGPRASDMMNDGQRKALMASYKGKSREQRISDASNFLGRQVTSFNDLTFSEASALLNALNEPQEA